LDVFDEDKYIVIPGELAVQANRKFEELADLLVEFHMRSRLTQKQMQEQLINLMKSAYALGFHDGLNEDSDSEKSSRKRVGIEVRKGRLKPLKLERDGSIPAVAFQMFKGIKLQRELAEYSRAKPPEMTKFVRSWLLSDKLKGSQEKGGGETSPDPEGKEAGS